MKFYMGMLLFLVSGILSAADWETDNLRFRGTLVESIPCKVSSNTIIVVDFGSDVQTTLVDGTYKKMQVPYTVQCPVGAPSAMSIRIEGTGAAFDSGVLVTNISNFGIAILNGGTRLPINSSKDFTYPNLPQLYAVPVKRTDATLSGGVFSAVATMRVEYR
ncbi:fimbrial protein [Pseudomonas sp. TH32]|uniref:fimbrial protein n=1 Tax=Pseudomonas sp. TH32 TaxID=2796397 RepID=UPI001911E64B|nr:fimbrial protein [Pseudomonas sp. TH32]MBK5436008.1 fimbrial protein [Pseudomonas sp. TH32]